MITDPIRFQNKIAEQAMLHISEYYESEGRQRLYQRMQGLKKAFLLKYDEENFNIQVPIILLRPLVLKTMAVLHANFKQDPLFTLSPAGVTNREQAYTMEEVLNWNLKATEFRRKALAPLEYDLALYGSGLVKIDWNQANSKYPKTINKNGMVSREYVNQNITRAVATRLHHLDYFCSNGDDRKQFEGWVERKPAFQFLTEITANKENYIIENVQKSIPDITNGSNLLSEYYHLVNTDLNDYITNDYYKKFGFVDVYKFYMYCNFEGNVNDTTSYYGELLPNGKLIRFHENPHDEYKNMITPISYYQQEGVWWGNSIAEPTILHEKYYRLLSNIETRQAIREVEPFTIYDSDTFSRDDLNSHLIGVPMRTNPNKTIDQFIKIIPQQSGANQRLQMLKSDLLANHQKLDISPNLSGTPSQGAINNRSSAGAQILAQTTDLTANYVLERCSQGLCDVAQNMIVMLKQRLDFSFIANRSKDNMPLEIIKTQILGDYFAECKTAPTSNKDYEIQKDMNTLNWIMSLLASGHPDLQNVKLYPMIKEILRKSDKDPNEILPEPQAIQNMPQPMDAMAMSPGATQLQDQMQPFMGGV